MIPANNKTINFCSEERFLRIRLSGKRVHVGKEVHPHVPAAVAAGPFQDIPKRSTYVSVRNHFVTRQVYNNSQDTQSETGL